ncbi:MAG: hypothetical protein NTV43_13740 [Methylococcales bacterium]|nr:hypothetical protein [Methylococcales bacterium]
MPSYQTLDLIADTYLPLLAVMALAVVCWTGFKRGWRPAARRFIALTAGLLIAYGLMFLDQGLHLWPKLNLDYSTHTAVALVLASFLAVCARTWAVYWLGSLLVYLLLMVYQHYHSLADILTTAAVVAPINLTALILLLRNDPASPKKITAGKR